MNDDQQEALWIMCGYTAAYCLVVTVLVCSAIAALDWWVNRGK